MKTTTKQALEIAKCIALKRYDLFSYSSYEKITDYIWDAWENWNEETLKTYYKGEKPTNPPHKFIIGFVVNELEQVPENWEDLVDSWIENTY